MPKKLFSTQRPLLREGLVPLQVWPHALVALKLGSRMEVSNSRVTVI